MGTCLDETPERPKVWLVQLAPNIWEKIMYYPPKWWMHPPYFFNHLPTWWVYRPTLVSSWSLCMDLGHWFQATLRPTTENSAGPMILTARGPHSQLRWDLRVSQALWWISTASCRAKNWSKGFRPNKVVKSPSGSENKKSTDFQFVPYKNAIKNAITGRQVNPPFPTQPSSIPETWWDDRKERHGPHRLSTNLHHEKHNNFWFKVEETTDMYSAKDMNYMSL